MNHLTQSNEYIQNKNKTLKEFNNIIIKFKHHFGNHYLFNKQDFDAILLSTKEYDFSYTCENCGYDYDKNYICYNCQ